MVLCLLLHIVRITYFCPIHRTFENAGTSRHFGEQGC